MIHRIPPRLATWLFNHLGAGRHRESIAGDLIEQYARGRGRLWYWRQIVVALMIARAGTFRTRVWRAARRMLFHVAIEAALVLGAVTVIDQSRRSHDLQQMFSGPFLSTMALLMTVPLLSLFWLRQPRKSKGRNALVNHLIVIFAVAALGAGTLTWAAATRQACDTETCRCQKTANPITAPR